MTKDQIIQEEWTFKKIGKITRKRLLKFQNWKKYFYLIYWLFIPVIPIIIISIITSYLNIQEKYILKVFLWIYLIFYGIIGVMQVSYFAICSKDYSFIEFIWFNQFITYKLETKNILSLDKQIKFGQIGKIKITKKKFDNFWKMLYLLDFISKDEYEKNILYKSFDKSYINNLHYDILFKSWKDVFSFKTKIKLIKRAWKLIIHSKKTKYFIELKMDATVKIRKEILEDEFGWKITMID